MTITVRKAQRARAFTLLELAVVMAIVALGAALVIRTTIKLRDGVGDVACQGNMRQLLSAIQMYNNDHNSSMPYGFYWSRSDPVTWEPVGNKAVPLSWVREIDRYLGTAGPGLAPAFRCPTALQQAPPHLVSYVMNFIVGVSPVYEHHIGATPPNAQTKPPGVHLMLRPGTALIWDTGIPPDAGELGYLVGADLDGERFWNGAHTPQYRYFSPHDPFGSIPTGAFGNNRPVQLNLGSYVFYNRDPGPVSTDRWPYQGNLRFRHDGQTQCNVAFADGSVRQFTAVVAADLRVTSHDALRRYFMIHWPPGVRPNPSQPN